MLSQRSIDQNSELRLSTLEPDTFDDQEILALLGLSSKKRIINETDGSEGGNFLELESEDDKLND